MTNINLHSYVDNIPTKSEKNPDLYNCIIEIPKGTNQKYEYNEKYNIFQLNRTLPSTLTYPMSYGFLPGTLAEDHDPLDIIVYGSYPISTGIMVECGVMGALWLKDKGKMDYKIVVIPKFHHKFKKYKDVKDLDPIVLSHTKNFFEIYKLDKKEVMVKNWMNKSAAIKIIEKSMKRYQDSKNTLNIIN